MAIDTHEQESRLLALPKLNQWFAGKTSKPPRLEEMEDFHLFFIARSINSSHLKTRPSWITHLDQVITSSPSLLRHILETDALAAELGSSLVDLYGILAEHAVVTNYGPHARHVLRKIAHSTDLAAFHFLVAWISFNLNELDECIQECELVNEPFGPVHTLLGQALLESGKVSSAIDALNVAIRISPNDPLPLVQLIKAQLVAGMPSECFKAIDRCRQLVGNNIEIDCLAAMAILSSQTPPKDFCLKTLEAIAAHMSDTPTDVNALELGMELAAGLGLKDWSTRFANIWVCAKEEDSTVIAKNLAKILKRNRDLNWHDVSKIILDKALSSETTLSGRTAMQ